MLPVETLKVWRSVCFYSILTFCEVINVENLHTFMHEEWEVEVNLGLIKNDAKEKSIGLYK